MWNINKDIEIVTSLSRLRELVFYLKDADYLAVDTETNGLTNNRIVVGLGIAPSEDEAYYIPLFMYENGELVRPWNDENWNSLKAVVKNLLLNKKNLITHNGSFDAKAILNTLDFQIIDHIAYDTQLLHHTCIDENPPHGLKPLAAKFLDPNASNPQDDVKAQVLAKGGSWVADNKEMYKPDYETLGKYCAMDVCYTYGLYNKFKGALEDPVLRKLWDTEVLPLIKVTYELNTTGVRVDIPYFKQLKSEMEEKIAAIEDEVYAQVEDQVRDYEITKIVDDLTFTERSHVGKHLKALGLPIDPKDPRVRHEAHKWYLAKNKAKRVLNLDSGDDKAYLLYDVLKLPIKAYTASGKPSTAKSLLDELTEEFEDSSAVIKLIRERSKEIKLLSTYVEPIIEQNQNGRIYPSFNQTGTTSGRYSCGGNSLNLQTLPRDDLRIKKGFIPDEGTVFVGADYESLEPHVFAHISNEPGLQTLFDKGYDFYSTIAIDVLGLKGVSANPNDSNYLGKVDKKKRQFCKAFALAVPYGAGAGRIAQILKMDYEEALDLINKYLKTYPSLKKWMDISELKMKTRGYVDTSVGRRKRGKVVHLLHTKYGINNFTKRSLSAVHHRVKHDTKIEDSTILYLECRNTFNVAKNHQIQSLGASVINIAMIDVQKEIAKYDIDAKIMLNVHDEVVLIVKTEHAKLAGQLLERCMIDNAVTRTLTVKLSAVPVITDKNLSTAK